MRDVLIVGGGIIGLCAALELRRRGRDVLVLDAADRIPPASWAGGGILSPLFPWRYPEAVTALTHDTVPRYRELVDAIQDAGGSVELDQCGLLVACPAERDRAGAWAHEHKVRLRECSSAEIQPGLSFAEGLYFPELGAIRNPDLLAGLRRLLANLGVVFREEKATAIDSREGAVEVSTEAATYRAGQILIAAGKASDGLLKGLGMALPLFPVKGQMLMYRARPGQLRTVVLTDEGYLIPRRDGRVLAGSTLEPGEDSVMPTREAGERLHRAALSLWPELRGCPLEAQWAGVRPGCRDDIPWIGRVPGRDRLWLATGHYRNGLAAAPATGELVAALMSDEAPSLDPGPYDPARRINAAP